MALPSTTAPRSAPPVVSGAVAKTPPSWLPFARFNLRCNPFGELTRDERAVVAVVEADRWLEWLQKETWRAVQFIGPCGRGKTTHLLALQAHLPGAHYVYLPQVGPLPAIPASNPLLVDEAQRLPWRVRREVFRRGAMLILGTHTNLTRPLRRAGYRVQTVAVAQSTDTAQVHAIMNRRIDLARLALGPVPQLTMTDAQSLVGRFGNNVRAMEADLYEQMQRHAEPPMAKCDLRVELNDANLLYRPRRPHHRPGHRARHGQC